MSSEDVKYESCPKSQGLEIYPSPALGNKSKELRKNRSSPTQFQQEELSTSGTQELLKPLLINFYLCQAWGTTDAERKSTAPAGCSHESNALPLCDACVHSGTALRVAAVQGEGRRAGDGAEPKTSASGSLPCPQPGCAPGTERPLGCHTSPSGCRAARVCFPTSDGGLQRTNPAPRQGRVDAHRECLIESSSCFQKERHCQPFNFQSLESFLPRFAGDVRLPCAPALIAVCKPTGAWSLVHVVMSSLQPESLLPPDTPFTSIFSSL